MPLVLRAKAVVLGDPGVGKSALVQTFHSDGQHFPKNYNMTTGVELIVKSVTLTPSAMSAAQRPPLSSRGDDTAAARSLQQLATAGSQVELHLYDCSGQEAYEQAVESHAEAPDLCLLVYDVTNETSFSRCERWLERLPKLLLSRGRGNDGVAHQQRSQQQKQQLLQAPIPTVLVAHKVDLDNRRIVTPSQGHELAQSCGLAYFEVSSKEGQNVELPFLELAIRYAELYAEKCAQIAELVN